jgi:hypothetical protein
VSLSVIVTGSWVSGVGCRVLVVGGCSWVLGVGCWLSGAGCRVLVVGCRCLSSLTVSIVGAQLWLEYVLRIYD